ncbi:MAG: ATP-binding protein [Aestuariivita sp.]|nr:ATP-binding protein [Aestuariivita sp.]
MSDTRVALISGPRQAGKTTLVKKLTGKQPYVTLDDESVYQAARSDPVSFIRQFDRVTIDEIQRVPDLIRQIKISVDDDQRAGRFLLTGSSNILTVPTVSESLAGRMAISELLPLSQVEIERRQVNLLDTLFEISDASISFGPYDASTLVDRVLTGGYPEMKKRLMQSRQWAWADDYVRTLLSRDIRDIIHAHQLKDISQLLRASAVQSAQLVVYSNIARSLRLSVPTVQRYIRTLEQMYLVRFLPAWHRNALKRLIRTPKLHFLDSGLLSAVRRITHDRLMQDRRTFGFLLETFIFSELLKLATCSDRTYDFFHYRDKDKVEVDFVIEQYSKGLIGVEVKASATVRENDFKGLKRLQSVTGTSFVCGCVFYAGDNVLWFGDKLLAVPVPILWTC